jgi:hypothetical protein
MKLEMARCVFSTMSSLETPNVRTTSAAATKLESPGYAAAIEHEPIEASATVALETVQVAVVGDAKLTGNPELAIAVRPTDPLSSGVCSGPTKVMTFAPCVTLQVRKAFVATTKFASSAWDAMIEQVPAETRVTVLAANVHTGAVVEAKPTVRPELAIADASVVGPGRNQADPDLTRLTVEKRIQRAVQWHTVHRSSEHRKVLKHDQMQIVINQWLRQFNRIRAHQALGMRPPIPETVYRNVKKVTQTQGALHATFCVRSGDVGRRRHCRSRHVLRETAALNRLG